MDPHKPTQQELEDIFAPKEKGKLSVREIEEPLEWFKAQMEAKLRENDHKGGWEVCTSYWLFQRLLEETDELDSELMKYGPPERDYENIIKEAADVANFAMMIADKARKTINRINQESGY